jgi:hypothetical protein
MQICENLDVREVPQRDSTYTNVSEWDYRTKQTRTVDQAKLEAVTWINNEYERDWKNILTLTSTTSKTPRLRLCEFDLTHIFGLHNSRLSKLYSLP